MLTQESKNGIITTYNYDKNGNLTTESDGTQYTYDAFNQLVETDKQDGTWQQNVYDATGLRMATVENGTYTGYTYDRDNIIAEYNKDDSRTTRYIRGYGLISQKKDAGETYNYLHNAHGDITKLVDSTGNVQNSYSYDAIGNTITYSEKVGNQFRYAGEQYDSITGEYYLRARYYDPTIGRFMNEDTYKGQIENPQSMNLYAYCVNNPVIYTDPSGHNSAKCNIDQGMGNGNVSNVPGDYNNNGIPDQYEPKSNLTQGIGKNKRKNLVTLKNLDDFGFYMGSTAKQRKSNLAKLNRVLKAYDITTPLRIAFFLGEVAHESLFGSRTLEQFSGNSPETYFNKKYSNNSDLGNNGGSDGELFRGSGYIHLTGRYNYQQFANYIGDQSIMKDGYQLIGGVYNKPVSKIKAGDVGVINLGKYAWESAGWFWKYGNPSGKNLNDLADIKDYSGVFDGVNKKDRGTLKKRNSNINKMYKILTGRALGLPQ
jgi:RHS repeat-associated protein